MKVLSRLLLLTLFHTIIIIYVETVTVTSNKTVSYDPAELLAKIFKPNVTLESRQRGYGFIKFEDQADPGLNSDNPDPGPYGLIDLERDPRPLRFEDDYDSQNNDANFDTSHNYQNYNEGRPVKFEDSENSQQDLALNNGGQVNFQDDNKVEDQGNKKKRKRRRRRKPKNGVLPSYSGADGLPHGRPGFQRPVKGGYGLNPYGNPGYPGAQPFRRPRRRRPKPSLAAEALSSITVALTSIARYDDYQCVPRLLCEAAGGGTLGDNGVLQSIAGIQPLLTLLSAYNGISTSPLFVFGRAVFLGMTSKGNTGTCRYAYSQCPTDPEQLIYYLNNHNGGFFRFFSAPQTQNQNLEQFYNQLSQGYGLYQPNPSEQNYGYPSDQNSGQNYGYYQNNLNNNYPKPYRDQNYGLQKPGPYDRPASLYNNENQNYGPNYAYDSNNYGSGNQIGFKENNAKLENRIQNKPSQTLADDSFEDDDVKSQWLFPDSISDSENHYDYNTRDSRTLKFPEESQTYNDQKDSNRKRKQLNFPTEQNNYNNYYNRHHLYTNHNNKYPTTTYSYNNGQNNHNYHNNNLNIYTNNEFTTSKYDNFNYNNHNNGNYETYQNYYNNRQNSYNNNHKYPSTTFNNEEYVFDHKHNFYIKKENYNNFKRNENDGLQTVYVVRGHGDPYKPEIVKLRPGQTLPL